MKKTLFLFPLMMSVITACSPVNSEFSCNKTAGDSCLTIEQVDAMTHYADDPIFLKKSKAKQIKKQDFYLSKQNPSSGVWIALNNKEKTCKQC